jgi:biopolymer transport protein ExbB/TolQ
MQPSFIFAVVAIFLMLLPLVAAISHRTTFWLRSRKIPILDVDMFEKRVQAHESANSTEWLRDLPANHPSTAAVQWACEKPHRLDHPDLIWHRLDTDVNEVFADVSRDAHLTMTSSPLAGMFFTASGMSIFIIVSNAAPSISSMVHTLGTALITTAMGVFIAILEKRLLQRGIACQRERLLAQGSRLIHALLDAHREVNSQPPALLTTTRLREVK